MNVGDFHAVIANLPDNAPVTVLDTRCGQEHEVEDVSTSPTVTLEICAR